MHTEKKAMWGHSKKMSIYKPIREFLPETNFVGSLILNFQVPQLWENHVVVVVEATQSVYHIMVVWQATTTPDLI